MESCVITYDILVSARRLMLLEALLAVVRADGLVHLARPSVEASPPLAQLSHSFFFCAPLGRASGYRLIRFSQRSLDYFQLRATETLISGGAPLMVTGKLEYEREAIKETGFRRLRLQVRRRLQGLQRRLRRR